VGFGVETWWYRSFNEAAAVEACSFSSFTVAVGDLMTEKKSLLHLLCTNVSTCVAIALALALGDSETWETQMHKTHRLGMNTYYLQMHHKFNHHF
jgi:hypothetical protein